ncbi:MAG: NAD(P)H-dependent oxidoreductase [Pseudomonadota bacterium]
MTITARRVFIWNAHPKSESFCGALADAYEAGAREAGAIVRRIELEDMRFDMTMEGDARTNEGLEPDLVAWREALAWCDHVFVVHPYWWAAMPAKAKAVLDRALTSGFAFKYHKKGVMWDKYFTGKTADAVITSDTPPWLDTLLYGKPARKVLKNQVLGFVGIKVRNVRQLGSVKVSSAEKRQKWLEQIEALGRRAAVEPKPSILRRLLLVSQPKRASIA